MKLSIVTAQKDGFEYFQETIDSLLSQTHNDWEWIIVDDGSREPLTSAFPELTRDSRIRVNRHPASQGQTLCLNEGILLATSDWIVRADGDDVNSKTRLENIVQAIHRPATADSPKLIFSDYDVIDEKGNQVSEVRYRTPLSERFFHYLNNKNNPICHPSVAFYKKSPNRGIYQYNSSLRNAQDYELWKRILQDWGKEGLRLVSTPLVKYRVVSTSLSGAYAAEQKTELQEIKKNQIHGSAVSSPKAQILDGKAKQAMQDYRLLYYNWLGIRPPTGDNARYLLSTANHAPVFPKALFWFFTLPFRSLIKRYALGGVYR